MGLVYHAVDPTIGRPVAIKTIRLGDGHNPTEREKLRERLFREARAAGILSHPNIVTIYDMEAEDEVAFIAMEFVDGPSLEQLMAEGEPIAPARALRLLRQTCGALDYAHRKGIVHRDIKPANILIAAGDLVKITDFGIAKAATSDQHTMTGTIVGTPNYMAPEQVQGLTVDGRSDQFSLGVIAFELLTGDKPFTGEHLTAVVYKIVAEEPAPPHRLNPTLGLKIDAVVRKALSKKPDQRYASCLDFVNALEAACDATRGWTLIPRGAASSLPTVVDQPRATVPPPTFRTRRDAEPANRSSALPLIAALIMAGGLIGLIAWQVKPAGENKPEPTPAAAAVSAPDDAGGERKPSPIGESAAEPPKTEEAPPAATQPAAEPPPTTATAEPDDPPVTETEPEARPRPTPRVRAPVEQAVSIVTNPPGAYVVLDRDPAKSCQTPCSLEAPPGRHTLSISLAGHQTERREVVIGESGQELPLITLRPHGGTLMLSSTPQGAAILINGRLRPETTPARLNLPPGQYSITVEKDGMRKTVQVEIRNGVTKYQPVQLGS
jgi:serine/threonine-protein kinase